MTKRNGVPHIDCCAACAKRAKPKTRKWVKRAQRKAERRHGKKETEQ